MSQITLTQTTLFSSAMKRTLKGGVIGKYHACCFESVVFAPILQKHAHCSSAQKDGEKLKT